MIRVVAVLILLSLPLTAPAWACSTNASSTFCADGWVAQPPPDRQARQTHDDQENPWSEDGMNEAFSEGDGVYVEGAVVVGDPAAEDDGQL